jgi:HlyD family secretion protein
MNAEVRIHVEQQNDALQLPVQALAETKGHYFTLVKTDDDYETREIEIGSTNDKVATIRKGLKEGDEVIMNPRSAGGLLELPKLPDPSPIAHHRSRGEAASEMTAADVVAQFHQQDTNKDNKLSKDEIATLEARVQQRLLRADTNGDGVLEHRELLTAADNLTQQRGQEAKTTAGPAAKEPSPRARDDARSRNSETAGGA